ncbi:MAG: thioredoxin [Campylobacterales bacterium]|nr:thioredoxin [Campylobacterales bacterium]
MAYIELTEKNFSETIENNDIVVIDFWAEWCGPCKAFGPVFEKVANEVSDVVFAKVNTEVEQALAGHFQIRSIPTLMILRENIIVFNQAGALPEDGLKDIVQQVKDLDMEMVRKEIEKQNQEGQE